jgi:hypothetical protein
MDTSEKRVFNRDDTTTLSMSLSISKYFRESWQWFQERMRAKELPRSLFAE